MSRARFKLVSLTGVFALGACAQDVLAPKLAAPEGIPAAFATLPVIHVSTVDSLYAVVNNPANAGRDVLLEPTTYTLDPTKPFGGRLELQPDMILRGKGGLQASVIIDASELETVNFMDGTLLTGAIRVGRGSNTVASLTIRNAASGSAGIETDLVGSGPTNVLIHHVIATGNPRGIDVRTVGAAMAHRTLTIELSENELFDNLKGSGQGLRIVNANGATGATIAATLDDNKIRGNIAGCLAANLNTDSASITIDSHADRFEGNGNGCVFLAGNASGAAFARANSISFRAQSSRFENNGTTIPPAVDPGAVLAVGAVSTQAGHASNNTLVVDLWGILFRSNGPPDIATFGAQSGSGSPAGTGNSATVMLHGMSKDANWAQPVPSTPTEPAGTNTAAVVLF